MIPRPAFLILCLAVALLAGLVVKALGDAPDLSGPTDPGTTIVPKADTRLSQPSWWADAPRRPVPRPQARTLTVMGGDVVWYQVVELRGSQALVLRLEMTLDDYEAAGRLGRACDGCTLRVYVVKDRN